MSDAQANEAEKNIEIWKVKKLIKRLEAARGNGTSMISLIIRMFGSPLSLVQILITIF
jgi:peptide chain release factor subunit 1